MVNNSPHDPAAPGPEAHVAGRACEPELAASTPREGARPASDQPTPSSAPGADPAVANTAPANPGNANPAIVPPPPPSGSNAVWLAITLLNIVLIVFLLPPSLLKNDQVSFIIRLVTVVGAAGAFAAGLVWFKNLVTSLPRRRWFKVLNIVLLVMLILANVSQMSVITVHAQIESGTTLLIDEKQRENDGGAIRLSINNHKIKVSPHVNHKGRAREFRVTYKEMIRGIFGGYEARWTPLYLVYINTEDPNVEVMIRKTDGEFDAAFRKNPEPSKRGYFFESDPQALDTFFYRGGPNETGSEDVVHLPYGEYKFVGRKDGCKEREITLRINKGEPEGYTVNLGSLCETSD